MEPKEPVEILKDLLTNPFFCKNSRGEYLLVNRAFAQLAGRDEGSIVGMKAGDLFDDRYASADELRDAEAIRDGLVNYDIETGEGERRRAFSCRKMFLPAHDSSPDSIMCVMNETTARLRSEDLLRKFNMGIDQSPASIVITDPDGTIRYVNSTFTRVTGYPPEEAIGQNPRLLKSGIQSKEFYREMWNTISSGSSWKGEFHNRKKSGDLFWEIASIAPIMDHAGKITGYIAVKEDITYLKQIEDELRKSEEKNREILDAIPDIMFKMDRAGNYLDPTLERKIREVFPDPVRDASRTYREKAFETAAIQIFEYPVNDDGATIHYEARFINSGEDEILAIIRNITDRVRAEEEMKAARQAAENASRSKSDFLANMSHEIRTPLNSINGFIGLLKKTGLAPVQAEYLDIIDRSAENLLGIINDILDFSKIESGKIEIEQIPFSPAGEFDPTIAIFTEKARQKNISLYPFIDPALPGEVTGDPLRIRQVLINLLSNAIKFTPERGKIFVEITRAGEGTSACDVRFSVRDTGIGIPERKRRVIFEPFSQADSSVTRLYGGTGLGLSISTNLISLMGGNLALESRPGMGSTFHFTLRMGKCVPAPRTAFPRDISALIHCPAGGDEDLVDLLARYLESFGITPVRVSGPGESRGAPERTVVFLVAPENAADGTTERARSWTSAGKRLVLVTNATAAGGAGPSLPQADAVLRMPLNSTGMLNAMMDVLDPSAAVHAGKACARAEGAPRFRAAALVAEDNPVNQKLITLILEGYGITTDVASNGHDAYYMSASRRYDIIFMDVNMPVTDGIEATQMILARERENGETHVPIIALTAMAIKGDRERLLAAGMDDYLSKPIDTGLLEKVLRERLGRLEEGPPGSDGNQPRATAPPPNEGIELAKTAAELGIPVDVLRKIIVEFLESSEEYTGSLAAAVESDDMNALFQASHRLRGAAVNLRLKELADIASRIELSAKSGGGEDYGYLVARIRSELDALRTVMGYYRKR